MNGLNGMSGQTVTTVQDRMDAVDIPFNRPFRLLFSSWPWRSLLFQGSSFALGVFWFVTLVTLLSVGFSMIVIWVGLPILVMTLLLWIGGARLERSRINAMLETDIPSPYLPLPEGSWFARGKALVRDPAVWRDVIYLFMLFPVGIAELVIACVSVSIPIWFLTMPLFYRVPGAGYDLGFTHIDTFFKALTFGPPLGLLFIIPCLYLLVGTSWLHAWFAQWLIGPSPRAQLAQRVNTLTDSRSRMVDLAMLERRRIERDLHDGAQQRLVALAMNLGMAKEKLASDPEQAESLVGEAHEEAKRALAEIRDLVRGIHPAVLTDRGLDPAISALAGKCPVPVVVEVNLERRPPEAIETAAYFVVAEALTNIAKHSQASQAWVTVWQERNRLILEIADNGAGGAVTDRGTGLNGLRDRVAALDGTFQVDSPIGGPTWLRVELPCA